MRWSAFEGFEIGETLTDVATPEALETIAVDEPTMSMLFTINNSPFYGREGKFVTSRHIHDRLMKELDKNLALRIEPAETADSWIVYGRGVLHLSVLIETMRREGYELQVGQPQVIIHEIDGVPHEPVELLTVNLPEESASKIIDVVTRRKGEMTMMETKGDRTFLEFHIPSRGIIGLNNYVLTASAGEAVLAHRFLEYQPWKGDIERATTDRSLLSRLGRPTPMPSTTSRAVVASSSLHRKKSTLVRSSVSTRRKVTSPSMSARARS